MSINSLYKNKPKFIICRNKNEQLPIHEIYFRTGKFVYDEMLILFHTAVLCFGYYIRKFLNLGNFPNHYNAGDYKGVFLP